MSGRPGRFFIIFTYMVPLRLRQELYPGFFLVLVFHLLISGCIEQYVPDDEEVKTGIFVISADLTDNPGNQTIALSRSTTLRFPSFDAESGCFVQVEREDGSMIQFFEILPGIYEGFMGEDWLITGQAYKLHIITPEGAQYESSHEVLHPGGRIDSLYFRTELRPTEDPDITLEGIRFYLDFEIDNDAARYLRWQLIETWEIHNPVFTSRRMYDTDRKMKRVPDFMDNRICWITTEIPEIFTRDLGGISGKHYLAMPLHYVSTETQRLHHQYSLLVRQSSLSAEAFRYWDELGKNLQSKGTLFDSQPSLTPSNICNVENEEELVIGYFSLAGTTESRIIVEEVPGLTISENTNFCDLGNFPYSYARIPQELLPLFIAGKMIDGNEIFGMVSRECIDCREYKGSSNVQPEYW